MSAAKLVAQSVDIQGADNFPSGCSFSPDGLCVLTSTGADSKLRLYNNNAAVVNTTVNKVENDCDAVDAGTHEWRTVLTCDGGNAVRSYAWYPLMKSNDSGTCCFAAAARDQPVHLFDAYTSAIRATYCPLNALDEMESASVVTFDPSGQKIAAAGFRTDRTIHVFATAVPGRGESTVLRLGKTRRSSDGQKGLVSALCYSSSDGNYLCVGTYAPGSIYVYDERSGQQPTGTILNGLCVVGHGRSHARKKRRFAAIETDNHETATEQEEQEEQEQENTNWLSSAKVKWFQSRSQGGVTQLLLTNDYILYSASRRSNAIISWDLRMLSGNPDYQSHPVCGYGSFATKNDDTNQRLEFDLDSNASNETLYVGGQDKCVRIYNVKSGELKGTIGGLEDAANGVSFFGSSPSLLPNNKNFLAVATGSRRFPSEADLDQDAVPLESSDLRPPGYLRLYGLKET